MIFFVQDECVHLVGIKDLRPARLPTRHRRIVVPDPLWIDFDASIHENLITRGERPRQVLAPFEAAEHPAARHVLGKPCMNGVQIILDSHSGMPRCQQGIERLQRRHAENHNRQQQGKYSSCVPRRPRRLLLVSERGVKIREHDGRHRAQISSHHATIRTERQASARKHALRIKSRAAGTRRCLNQPAAHKQPIRIMDASQARPIHRSRLGGSHSSIRRPTAMVEVSPTYW